MSALPPAIAAKVAKLIPLLSSNQDGEALAAVRAIGRTLAAERLDFHALAAALTGAGTSTIYSFTWEDLKPVEPRPERQRPWPKKWGMPIWGTSKIEPWCIVANHCLALDWTIPKAHGGRFLTKEERTRLKGFGRWQSPKTDEDADWIEATCHRCHAVRDAWRAATAPKAA